MFRDDAVAEAQSQANSTDAPARREERIEKTALRVLRHALAAIFDNASHSARCALGEDDHATAWFNRLDRIPYEVHEHLLDLDGTHDDCGKVVRTPEIHDGAAVTRIAPRYLDGMLDDLVQVR